WEALRKRLWFMPKELNAQTDPYETVDTELVSLQNAYSLEYKDYYGNAIAYHDQFYQVGEFCKGSVFEVVFKESADGSTGDTNEGYSIYNKLYAVPSTMLWIKSDIRAELF